MSQFNVTTSVKNLRGVLLRRMAVVAALAFVLPALAEEPSSAGALHSAGARDTPPSAIDLGERLRELVADGAVIAEMDSAHFSWHPDAPVEDFVRQGVDPFAFAAVAPYQVEAPTVGELSTLVILVNFQDDQSEPTTPAEVEEILFNEANPDSLTALMLENSYGKTWFSGDVLDWVTLPVNAADCGDYVETKSYKLRNLADLVDPQVDFSLYRRIILLLVPGCPYGAESSLGDNIELNTDEGWVRVSVAKYPNPAQSATSSTDSITS